MILKLIKKSSRKQFALKPVKVIKSKKIYSRKNYRIGS